MATPPGPPPEEIIWLRENGFSVSSASSRAAQPPQLRRAGAAIRLHRPFTGVEGLGQCGCATSTELSALLEGSTKVIVHNEPVDDRLIGIRLHPLKGPADPSQAIAITEATAGRQLDPFVVK